METKLLAHKVDFVKRMLQFKECFRVDSQGGVGGLAMFWRREMKVEVINLSTYHIHVTM